MAIRLVNNDSNDYSSPTSAGAVGLDERLDFVDGKGNTVASITSDADGTQTLQVGGVKRYKALLTQAGTDAPVATVLENTLGGEVVWTRFAEAVYHGTLADVFVANKTFVLCNADASAGSGGGGALTNAYRGDANTLVVTSTGDGELNNGCVFVEVYP